MLAAVAKIFFAVTFPKSIIREKMKFSREICLALNFFRASIPCSHKDNRLHERKCNAADHRNN
jgi:hypothetical protein